MNNACYRTFANVVHSQCSHPRGSPQNLPGLLGRFDDDLAGSPISLEGGPARSTPRPAHIGIRLSSMSPCTGIYNVPMCTETSTIVDCLRPLSPPATVQCALAHSSSRRWSGRVSNSLARTSCPSSMAGCSHRRLWVCEVGLQVPVVECWPAVRGGRHLLYIQKPSSIVSLGVLPSEHRRWTLWPILPSASLLTRLRRGIDGYLSSNPLRRRVCKTFDDGTSVPAVEEREVSAVEYPQVIGDRHFASVHCIRRRCSPGRRLVNIVEGQSASLHEVAELEVFAVEYLRVFDDEHLVSVRLRARGIRGRVHTSIRRRCTWWTDTRCSSPIACGYSTSNTSCLSTKSLGEYFTGLSSETSAMYLAASCPSTFERKASPSNVRAIRQRGSTVGGREAFAAEYSQVFDDECLCSSAFEHEVFVVYYSRVFDNEYLVSARVRARGIVRRMLVHIRRRCFMVDGREAFAVEYL